MRSTLILLFPLLLVGVPRAQDPDDRATNLHDPFSAILAATVREERVDYLAIRDHHFEELTGYLDRLAATDLAELTPDERLAFLINLYNATMIRTVCERFVDRWDPSARDFGVFDEKLVRLGRQALSLNDVEHRRVRLPFGRGESWIDAERTEPFGAGA